MYDLSDHSEFRTDSLNSKQSGQSEGIQSPQIITREISFVSDKDDKRITSETSETSECENRIEENTSNVVNINILFF